MKSNRITSARHSSNTNVVCSLFQRLAIYILKKTKYKFKIEHSNIEIVLECGQPNKDVHIDNVSYIMYAKNVQGAFLGYGRWKSQGESWKDGHLRMIDAVKKSARVVV